MFYTYVCYDSGTRVCAIPMTYVCYDGGTRACAIPMCAMMEVLECVLYLCVL